MKKNLLFLAALTAMTTLPSQAAVTIEGDETGHDYETLSAAVTAAATGSTIIVDADYTETARITPGNKTLTVKGAEGKNIIVNYGGEFLISMDNSAGSLTVENLTFKYSLTAASGRNSINVGRGSLYLKNVTIDGANIKANDESDRYVISLDNGNSNIPNVLLENVEFTNCNAVNAQNNALVVVRNQNLTLSGDGNPSIYLKNNVNIKDASSFTGHADLYLPESYSAKSVVNNCTDGRLFSITLEGKCLLANGGNLVLADTPVVLNRTKSLGYTTLPAAVSAATTGDELVLYQDVTLTASQRLNGKTITIKGATGNEQIIRDDSFHKADASDKTNEVFFLTNNAADDLTLSDLVLNGNNVIISTAALLPTNGCKITLNNVILRDCSTTWERGLIDNPGSNAGTWHLNGVKAENCTATNRAQVVANAAGNSISGDNDFILRINGSNTVDATGVANAQPLGVVFSDTPKLNEQKTAFTGCSDTNQFFVRNAGCEFTANGDNLDVKRINATSITDIEADNDADAEWYTIQGLPADPAVPGLYIKVLNGKATKVLVK